ncbi:WD40 repeat domain-containing protein [Paractinoplanes durhamensis]|uniref:WD40 repeat domain-containing protein n=1 Tax=Paractinoplanes durhamensis TaxID=113563 RepID=UPI00363CEAE4
MARITAALEAGRPLTVVVDGVDEAVDPPELIRAVSALLAAYGGELRVLLAAGSELLPLFVAEAQIVDLDAAEYLDRDAVRELAGEELRRAMPDGSFATADAARAAEAIAAVPGQSFLTARIVAASVAAGARLTAVDDPQWQAALPDDLSAAVHADLSGRLGDDAARARALLLPLAYAQGAGLPWEDTWPALAEALHPGDRYGHDDVRRLCDSVPGYLVEDLSDGQSVYRLSHAALADCLRAGRDETADHRAIAGALRAAVPRTAGRGPSWADAQAYTRTHLITHAAAGQDVDDLFTDVGFLIVAAHPQMVAALPAARSEAAQAAVDAYRRAEEQATEGTHAAYLELAARCGGATTLADAFAEFPRPWSARWASWHVDLPHRPLAGHTGAVLCAAVGQRAGADVAVTGSDDHTLRRWDLTSSEPIAEPLCGHTAGVTAVATGWIGDRPVAVSGSDDRTIRRWDLVTGSPIGEP